MGRTVYAHDTIVTRLLDWNVVFSGGTRFELRLFPFRRIRNISYLIFYRCIHPYVNGSRCRTTPTAASAALVFVRFPRGDCNNNSEAHLTWPMIRSVTIQHERVQRWCLPFVSAARYPSRFIYFQNDMGVDTILTGFRFIPATVL